MAAYERLIDVKQLNGSLDVRACEVTVASNSDAMRELMGEAMPYWAGDPTHTLKATWHVPVWEFPQRVLSL